PHFLLSCMCMSSSFYLFVLLRYLFRIYSIHTPTTEIYSLSLHERSSDLPSRWSGRRRRRGSSRWRRRPRPRRSGRWRGRARRTRSEEHTSELQSRFDLVCRLLLEKKKISDKEAKKSSERPCKRTNQ